MAKCDLCGKYCLAHEMASLVKNYHIENVTDICKLCEKWANKTKSDMLLEIPIRMRSAIKLRHVALTNKQTILQKIGFK